MKNNNDKNIYKLFFVVLVELFITDMGIDYVRIDLPKLNKMMSKKIKTFGSWVMLFILNFEIYYR
jgi:hypothetical protein